MNLSGLTQVHISKFYTLLPSNLPTPKSPLKSLDNRDFPGGPAVEISPSNAGCVGLIPGWGAKISRPSQPENQNIKQKQCCNKFNKGFKNGPHQKKKILNFNNHICMPKMNQSHKLNNKSLGGFYSSVGSRAT